MKQMVMVLLLAVNSSGAIIAEITGGTAVAAPEPGGIGLFGVGIVLIGWLGCGLLLGRRRR